MDQQFIYNSRLKECKLPFGACIVNEEIELNFKAKDGIYIEDVYLVINKDNEQQKYLKFNYKKKENNYSIFNLKFKLSEVGLYWYFFHLNTEKGSYKLYKNIDGNLTYEFNNLYQITVYDKNYKVPSYVEGAIVYHIFVDRFNTAKNSKNKNKAVFKKWNENITIKDNDGIRRANDFYSGDFQGIIDKLDYIKSLNANILYLSPIFLSPSNHRYDTSDYLKIDPILGDEETFKKLIKEAKKRNIHIVLDGVFNHTGVDSIYFNKFNSFDSLGAYQSTDSDYFAWYDFDEYPDNYRCWWGVTICPSVNQNNLNYRKFITNEVIPKWTSMGVSGWRLDVVDELKPIFVKEIRKSIKNFGEDKLLIGEVWEDASNKISYSQRREYFQGKELDGVMNYVFKNAIEAYVKYNNIDYMINTVSDIVENYPKQSLNSSFTLIGSHDTVRAVTRYSDAETSYLTDDEKINFKLKKEEKDIALKRLEIASLIQFTLPGIPSIYYGDEIGTEGLEDPLNRTPFIWENINNDINIHYKKLGEIRTSNKEIYSSDIRFYKNDSLLIYSRGNNNYIFHIINNSCKTKTIDIKENTKIIYFKNCEIKNNIIVLNPLSYVILKDN